ncbi:hypothetical protein [Nocardia sp. NPDC050710]|uniref:hypothetical protein n=1 Tax=Nocardia sp. NPDC050710 TaxID=3157220 RepID=UPI0033C58E12
MTVEATEWTMISDVSPEYAYRDAGTGDAVWRLSWLPDRRLTREQALAGMELDELLSDLSIVHDRIAHAQAASRADTLGIMWEHALILLSKRIEERLQQQPGDQDDTPVGAPTGRDFRPYRTSLRPKGSPHVRN